MSLEYTIETSFKGIPLKFQTTHGLFSYREIDTASRLLTDTINTSGVGSAFEIGCGYGAIGISIAKLNPDIEVEMIDRDFVAIQYAKKNISLNSATNATAYLSNVFSEVGNKKFDLIFSNLPTHISHDFLRVTLENSKQFLNPNGRVVIVGVSKISRFYKETMTNIFGNCEILKEQDKFSVISSQLLLH